VTALRKVVFRPINVGGEVCYSDLLAPCFPGQRIPWPRFHAPTGSGPLPGATMARALMLVLGFVAMRSSRSPPAGWSAPR
jgi:hypothetical protein